MEPNEFGAFSRCQGLLVRSRDGLQPSVLITNPFVERVLERRELASDIPHSSSGVDYVICRFSPELQRELSSGYSHGEILSTDL